MEPVTCFRPQPTGYCFTTLIRTTGVWRQMSCTVSQHSQHVPLATDLLGSKQRNHFYSIYLRLLLYDTNDVALGTPPVTSAVLFFPLETVPRIHSLDDDNCRCVRSMENNFTGRGRVDQVEDGTAESCCIRLSCLLLRSSAVVLLFSRALRILRHTRGKEHMLAHVNNEMKLFGDMNNN